ncbi:MAG: proton-conducting transporter membrane subunit [Pseudomonadota bacterium]
MTNLDELLIFSGLSLLALFFARKSLMLRQLAPVLYACILLILIKMSALAYGGAIETSSFTIELLGFEMSWRFDALSWFFAVITLIAALASAVFMSGDWARYYCEQQGEKGLQRYGLLHLVLMLNVFTMLILLASGDLLSLFIGWELVSWASFWMMALSPEAKARQAAVKYLVYAMAGAMALLAAIAMIYAAGGTLQYGQLVAVLTELSKTQQIVLVLLFSTAFSIKFGLVPFHLWQAKAYAYTPGPGAAFLAAISSRVGLYAFVVVFVQLIGFAQLHSLDILHSVWLNIQNILLWIAALTVIIPTYIALQQHDAKRLLAWHGIGQGGYMLLGLMMFDSIGTAGGLMHVFNYASYQAALFLTIVAVVYRTGTSDFNKLGGLVTQMPLTFLVMLIGIIGLAGLPPMNGFVSKWMVYRSLLLNGQPLLFVAAVFGTLGTILSVYKLIHNTFLGQLRLEHQQVKEVPWSMLIPMLALSLITFITGFMPGLILPWIASIQQSIGLPVIAYDLGGIVYDKGGLDMIYVCMVMFYGFGVGAVIFYFLGGRSKRVHQYDNYAGGHFLSSKVRYHYSNNFYPGLMNLIGPWYRGSVVWLEKAVVSLVSLASNLFEHMYRSRQPVMMLAVVMVFALFAVLVKSGASI